MPDIWQPWTQVRSDPNGQSLQLYLQYLLLFSCLLFTPHYLKALLWFPFQCLEQPPF